MIRIKRTYDPPARSDGRRILVERLWPRGMKKERLVADAWMKEVAPSTQLRKWFGHRVQRWDEFRRRYRAELEANPAAWEPIVEAANTLSDPRARLFAAEPYRGRGARKLPAAVTRIHL